MTHATNPNPASALVHLLGLCPLLAITNTAANGLALGIATFATVLVSNTLASSLRRHIPTAVRLPTFVIIIGATVTIVDLLMEAYTHTIHRTLGLFVPLIITNCVIIARAEAVASKNSLGIAFRDGLNVGFNFFLILIALGAIREIIGTGSLFANLGLLFNLPADYFHIAIWNNAHFLLALLPAGAFFTLALLIALYHTYRCNILTTDEHKSGR